MTKSTGLRAKRIAGQSAAYAVLSVLILLMFIPIILMLFLSVKSSTQIQINFWGFPKNPAWSNYAVAFSAIWQSMLNSFIYVAAAVVLLVLVSALSGYALGVMKFPCQKLIFTVILSMMMIPGILTLTPRYLLISDLGMKNSPLALILPWVSGGQVMAIVLTRVFMSQIPKSIFESARIDGAGDMVQFFALALPLSKSILTTIAIMNLVSFYNDYMWPLMVINDTSKQVATVVIQSFMAGNGSDGMGETVAGFVIITVPLLVMFSFTSKIYVAGLTGGALKG